jgi:hypothetical protein
MEVKDAYRSGSDVGSYGGVCSARVRVREVDGTLLAAGCIPSAARGVVAEKRGSFSA